MIPPSTTLTDSGRRTRRTLVWLLGGVVALNLVVWVAGSFSSGGSVAGPDGSSFVTTRSGSAAAAGMLERLDFEVVQSRLPLDEATLPPEATLLLIDAGSDFTTAELTTVDSFLVSGGTVVVAGRTGMVERLIVGASRWQTEGGATARPIGPGLHPDRFGDVALSGFGSFDVSADDTPILRADNGAIVGVTRQVGRGLLVWVADSHPFHNEGIGVFDSALAVVTLLAGDGVDQSGTIIFDEFRHGFRQDAGLWQVMPANWRLTLILAGLVGLLTLIAYGRRFGPPHDLRRRLPPSRQEYLEAVAGMMTRSGSTADAVVVIRSAARGRLEARSPAGTDLTVAAGAAGLDAAATEALLGDATDDETLMAADEALAILNRERT